MRSATVLLSLLLAVVCVASAMRDLRRDPAVIAILARIGCPYPPSLLGWIKMAAASGLVLGVWLEWLGSITAICLAGYFFIATAYHRKARDGIKGTAPAFFLTLLSFVTFVVSIVAA